MNISFFSVSIKSFFSKGTKLSVLFVILPWRKKWCGQLNIWQMSSTSLTATDSCTSDNPIICLSVSWRWRNNCSHGINCGPRMIVVNILSWHVNKPSHLSRRSNQIFNISPTNLIRYFKIDVGHHVYTLTRLHYTLRWRTCWMCLYLTTSPNFASTFLLSQDSTYNNSKKFKYSLQYKVEKKKPCKVEPRTLLPYYFSSFTKLTI